MSLYTLGRDEKYYDNPNEFIPERWMRDPDGGSKIKTIRLPSFLLDLVLGCA